MTKLTIEVLKEIIGSYPENSDEIECVMASQLLAYEQAAEHPAARITWDWSEFSVSNVSEDFLYGGTAVYLAPVLPKQPEHSRQHFESLCNQFWNWAELDEIDQDEEPRLEWNGSNYTHRVTAALWKMYQAAPAQPVIPEQPDAQDLELYIDMLENSDSDDQDGELNNTQLIMWLKELQRRRTLPAQPANGDKQ